jgi:hypothetical protein
MSNNKPVESNPAAILFLNIQKGKLGEKIAEDDYKQNGYKIIKTGIGSDFIAIKKFDDSEKPLKELVEVKTGKSRTTKRQKIIMMKTKRLGKKYTIYRVTDAFLDNYVKSNPALKRSEI